MLVFGFRQVLRQLAPDVSYRSLVVLGVASIQGLSVASFEKDDAERLLFFCGQQMNDTSNHDAQVSKIPQWLTPPLPTRKRSEPCRESKVLFRMTQVETSSIHNVNLEAFFCQMFNLIFFCMYSVGISCILLICII